MQARTVKIAMTTLLLTGSATALADTQCTDTASRADMKERTRSWDGVNLANGKAKTDSPAVAWHSGSLVRWHRYRPSPQSTCR